MCVKLHYNHVNTMPFNQDNTNPNAVFLENEMEDEIILQAMEESRRFFYEVEVPRLYQDPGYRVVVLDGGERSGYQFPSPEIVIENGQNFGVAVPNPTVGVMWDGHYQTAGTNQTVGGMWDGIYRIAGPSETFGGTWNISHQMAGPSNTVGSPWNGNQQMAGPSKTVGGTSNGNQQIAGPSKSFNSPPNSNRQVAGPSTSVNSPPNSNRQVAGPSKSVKSPPNSNRQVAGPSKSINSPPNSNRQVAGPSKSIKSPPNSNRQVAGPSKSIKSPPNSNRQVAGPSKSINSPPNSNRQVAGPSKSIKSPPNSNRQVAGPKKTGGTSNTNNQMAGPSKTVRGPSRTVVKGSQLFHRVGTNITSGESSEEEVAMPPSPIQFRGLDPNGFNYSAGETWIYPTNMPIRDYQFNIISNALFKNTLVCLPTGLGKTFIAAVVMYNFYRWFPQGKIIFLAPTKPLVHQQIDSCFSVMGFAKDETAEMTGAMLPNHRKKAWKECRVFFLTPQVMINDLARGACPAELIKCVVIDEAHKAKGNFAYCKVINALVQFNHEFRVLALSATPGSDMESVNKVVKNLLISNLELRNEQSLDTVQYVHERVVETIVVKLEGYHKECVERYVMIIESYLRRLLNLRVVYGTINSLSLYRLLQIRNKFRQNPPAELSQAELGNVESDLAVCMSLYYGLQSLMMYGMRSFVRWLDNILGKEGWSPSRGRLSQNFELVDLLNEMKDKLGDISMKEPEPDDSICIVDKDQPYIISHPKLERMREVVVSHFQTFQMRGESSRVMIFCQFRDVVIEICHELSKHRPLVKPMTFIGQSTSCQKSKGFTQKQQIKVMEKFRSGGYNTLISTCVGEEGLDIGEVDLIVCFDAQSSPIRLVQRMGRTGRKRQGRIVMLVLEGKEKQKYHQGVSNQKCINKALLNSKKLQLMPSSPRMVPQEFQPKCHRMFMTVQPKSPPQPKKNKVQPNQDLRKLLGPKRAASRKTSTAPASQADANIPTQKKIGQKRRRGQSPKKQPSLKSKKRKLNRGVGGESSTNKTNDCNRLVSMWSNIATSKDADTSPPVPPEDEDDATLVAHRASQDDVVAKLNKEWEVVEMFQEKIKEWQSALGNEGACCILGHLCPCKDLAQLLAPCKKRNATLRPIPVDLPDPNTLTLGNSLDMNEMSPPHVSTSTGVAETEDYSVVDGMFLDEATNTLAECNPDLLLNIANDGNCLENSPDANDSLWQEMVDCEYNEDFKIDIKEFELSEEAPKDVENALDSSVAIEKPNFTLCSQLDSLFNIDEDEQNSEHSQTIKEESLDNSPDNTITSLEEIYIERKEGGLSPLVSIPVRIPEIEDRWTARTVTSTSDPILKLKDSNSKKVLGLHKHPKEARVDLQQQVRSCKKLMISLERCDDVATGSRGTSALNFTKRSSERKSPVKELCISESNTPKRVELSTKKSNSIRTSERVTCKDVTLEGDKSANWLMSPILDNPRRSQGRKGKVSCSPVCSTPKVHRKGLFNASCRRSLRGTLKKSGNSVTHLPDSARKLCDTVQTQAEHAEPNKNKPMESGKYPTIKPFVISTSSNVNVDPVATPVKEIENLQLNRMNEKISGHMKLEFNLVNESCDALLSSSPPDNLKLAAPSNTEQVQSGIQRSSKESAPTKPNFELFDESILLFDDQESWGFENREAGTDSISIPQSETKEAVELPKTVTKDTEQGLDPTVAARPCSNRPYYVTSASGNNSSLFTVTQLADMYQAGQHLQRENTATPAEAGPNNKTDASKQVADPGLGKVLEPHHIALGRLKDKDSMVTNSNICVSASAIETTSNATVKSEDSTFNSHLTKKPVVNFNIVDMSFMDDSNDAIEATSNVGHNSNIADKPKDSSLSKTDLKAKKPVVNFNIADESFFDYVDDTVFNCVMDNVEQNGKQKTSSPTIEPSQSVYVERSKHEPTVLTDPPREVNIPDPSTSMNMEDIQSKNKKESVHGDFNLNDLWLNDINMEGASMWEHAVYVGKENLETKSTSDVCHDASLYVEAGNSTTLSKDSFKRQNLHESLRDSSASSDNSVILRQPRHIQNPLNDSSENSDVGSKGRGARLQPELGVVHFIGDEDDDDDFLTQPGLPSRKKNLTRTKVPAPSRKGNAVESRPKKKTRKQSAKEPLGGHVFIENEAEESIDKVRDSSDGEDTSGLDSYDNSFVDDSEQSQVEREQDSVDIQAKYLQSVRSPLKGQGQFKMSRPGTGNVISQTDVDDDDSYQEDSFCVADVASQQAPMEDTLEIAEAVLQERARMRRGGRRTKRRATPSPPTLHDATVGGGLSPILGISKKRRTRIITLSSDSEEENMHQVIPASGQFSEAKNKVMQPSVRTVVLDDFSTTATKAKPTSQGQEETKEVDDDAQLIDFESMFDEYFNLKEATKTVQELKPVQALPPKPTSEDHEETKKVDDPVLDDYFNVKKATKTVQEPKPVQALPPKPTSEDHEETKKVDDPVLDDYFNVKKARKMVEEPKPVQALPPKPTSEDHEQTKKVDDPVLDDYFNVKKARKMVEEPKPVQALPPETCSDVSKPVVRLTKVTMPDRSKNPVKSLYRPLQINKCPKTVTERRLDPRGPNLDPRLVRLSQQENLRWTDPQSVNLHTEDHEEVPLISDKRADILNPQHSVIEKDTRTPLFKSNAGFPVAKKKPLLNLKLTKTTAQAKTGKPNEWLEASGVDVQTVNLPRPPKKATWWGKRADTPPEEDSCNVSNSIFPISSLLPEPPNPFISLDPEECLRIIKSTQKDGLGKEQGPVLPHPTNTQETALNSLDISNWEDDDFEVPCSQKFGSIISNKAGLNTRRIGLPQKPTSSHTQDQVKRKTSMACPASKDLTDNLDAHLTNKNIVTHTEHTREYTKDPSVNRSIVMDRNYDHKKFPSFKFASSRRESDNVSSKLPSLQKPSCATASSSVMRSEHVPPEISGSNPEKDRASVMSTSPVIYSTRLNVRSKWNKSVRSLQSSFEAGDNRSSQSSGTNSVGSHDVPSINSRGLLPTEDSPVRDAPDGSVQLQCVEWDKTTDHRPQATTTEPGPSAPRASNVDSSRLSPVLGSLGAPSSTLVVLASSQSLGRTSEVVIALRSTHKIDVEVMSIGQVHFIVSWRAGVLRIPVSDLTHLLHHPLMISVTDVFANFTLAYLILECDSSTGTRREMWSPKSLHTVARLRKLGARIIFSQNKEHTANLLVRLCRIEMQKGHGIVVPKIPETLSNVMKFYECLPGVNPALAMRLWFIFPSLEEFIKRCSSVRDIQRIVSVNRENAIKIYERFLTVTM